MFILKYSELISFFLKNFFELICRLTENEAAKYGQIRFRTRPSDDVAKKKKKKKSIKFNL